jgi:hypothetical protein
MQPLTAMTFEYVTLQGPSVTSSLKVFNGCFGVTYIKQYSDLQSEADCRNFRLVTGLNIGNALDQKSSALLPSLKAFCLLTEGL